MRRIMIVVRMLTCAPRKRHGDGAHGRQAHQTEIDQHGDSRDGVSDWSVAARIHVLLPMPTRIRCLRQTVYRRMHPLQHKSCDCLGLGLITRTTLQDLDIIRRQRTCVMRESISKGVATEVSPGRSGRPKPLLHAFLFVLGFSIIFVALGTAVSGIGQLVFDLRDPLARIGGVVVILFGLATMGLFGDLSRQLDRLGNSAAGENRHWRLLPVAG